MNQGSGALDNGMIALKARPNNVEIDIRRTALVVVCVSACNFDPLSRGIGVQN
jgi:hypothetical protein